jgi:hypothetical protein
MVNTWYKCGVCSKKRCACSRPSTEPCGFVLLGAHEEKIGGGFL